MKKDYLVIDRAKWRTGGHSSLNPSHTGKGSTLLLNDEGYMCCLGFRCHQMGIPKQDLLGECTPEGLCELYTIPDLIYSDDGDIWADTSFTNDAIGINDDSELSIKEREKAITEHFKKIDVIVEFKGRYKKV
jgi:hypothetical protein